jgi:tetratricopeptide (TPR) repeat protein
LNEKLSIVYYAAPLFTLLLALLTYFTWKKYRFVAFGISFYIVNLLLVLQIFSVGSAVIAERYTYVPYIGIFFIVGCLLARFAKTNMTKAYSIIFPVALFFSILSFLQVQTWKDGATLWDSVIKNQPSSRAYSARATLLRKEKKYNEAINYYTQAIKLNAIDHESYNNRANIYMDMNKFDSAFVDYKQALAIKPDYYVAYDNLGGWYARRNRYDSALYYFNLVLNQKPDYKVTYSNRGLTFMALKRYDEAIKDWQTFLTFEPNAPDVLNTIGLCYRMQGKNQDALTYINRAIQVSPEAPFFLNRSYTYSALNNIENARKDALTAKQGGVQIDPTYAASLGIQ